MSDSKSHRFRPPLYHDAERNGEGPRNPAPGDAGSRERQGW
jgi:hypothetical protein